MPLMCNTYYSPSLGLAAAAAAAAAASGADPCPEPAAVLASVIGQRLGHFLRKRNWASLSLSFYLSLFAYFTHERAHEQRERGREGEKEKSRLCLKRLMDIATLFTPFPILSLAHTHTHTHAHTLAHAHTHALTYVRPTNWFLHLQQDNFGAIFFIPSLFLFSSLISLYLFVHLSSSATKFLPNYIFLNLKQAKAIGHF